MRTVPSFYSDTDLSQRASQTAAADTPQTFQNAASASSMSISGRSTPFEIPQTPSVAEPEYTVGILPVSSSSSKFVEGYKQFREHHYVESTMLYEALKVGQSPKSVVITCSDSRVDPALISGANPGEMFVIRHVGNVIPHPAHPAALSTYAALKYAVDILKVENVLILGHSSCGGINALMSSTGPCDDADKSSTSLVGEINNDTAIDMWMGLANPARRLVLAKENHKNCSHHKNDIQVPPNVDPLVYHRNVCCEQMNVVLGLDNLLQYDFISDKVKKRELVLHGWWNDLQDGQMFAYNGQTAEFVKL